MDPSQTTRTYSASFCYTSLVHGLNILLLGTHARVRQIMQNRRDERTAAFFFVRKSQCERWDLCMQKMATRLTDSPHRPAGKKDRGGSSESRAAAGYRKLTCGYSLIQQLPS